MIDCRKSANLSIQSFVDLMRISKGSIASFQCQIGILNSFHQMNTLSEIAYTPFVSVHI